MAHGRVGGIPRRPGQSIPHIRDVSFRQLEKTSKFNKLYMMLYKSTICAFNVDDDNTMPVWSLPVFSKGQVVLALN